MQIGFDISVLRIAQAGVLRYTHDLLEELIAQDDAHAWTLLDVLALNRDKPMQPLAAFNAAQCTRCVLSRTRAPVSKHASIAPS
jgi:hypothetical protein